MAQALFPLRRLRMYLWRQLQNGHRRFNELRRRGVQQFLAAVVTGSSKGAGASQAIRRFRRHWATPYRLAGIDVGSIGKGDKTDDRSVIASNDVYTSDLQAFLRDDGWLTDSEIANLRLDADWRMNSKEWRVIWCSGRPNLGCRLQENGGPDLRLLSTARLWLCR